MFAVFFLLLLFSVVVFIIGVHNPALFFRNETKGSKKAIGVLGGLVAMLTVLTGITTPAPQSNIAGSTTTTPESIVTLEATPTNVVPTVASTVVPRHNGVFVKVTNVVDGDTIKIKTGETLRYIGIDTPETVHPDKPVMCYGKEASDKNASLVEGKIIEIEKDVSEKDRYGRILRYVWLDDVLINELLVREGYALSSSYPPDIKYQDRFVEAQRLAREEQKGLWSSVCAVSPTSKPTNKVVQNTPVPTSVVPAGNGGLQSGGGEYVCNCSKTCSQMSSCSEAQYQLNVCGCSARDADDDGVACDSDCQ